VNAIDMIAAAVPVGEFRALPCPPHNGICAITGNAGPCIPRKHLLTKSFTNHDLLAAPSSPDVGVAAFRALRYNPERMSSWLCTGESFRKLRRVEVRPLVLAGVEADVWAGYITTSYHKHGSLRTPVNHGSRAVWLFEMRLVDCTDRERVNAWYDVMNEALHNGIGRMTIESLSPPPGVLKAIGLARWQEFYAWAQPKHRSALYALLTYLMPSQEEMECEP